MNSVQESKHELEAAIRYAENAISSAKTTIESMEFRQEMAQKQFSEQTGREKALQNQVDKLKSEGALLDERIGEMKDSAFADANTIKHLKEVKQELESKVQGQYDDIKQLEYDLTAKTAQASAWKKKYYDFKETLVRAGDPRVVKEKAGREQALQAQVKLLEERIADMTSDMVGDASTIKELRDIIDRMGDDATGSSVTINQLNDENDLLKAQVNALEQPEQPTMPVIPKAVAIAIFREGVQHGVEAACTELEGSEVRVEESEYVGDFHVTFERRIDLDDELDLDWMRDKCGDYSEERVIDALGTLCADKEFECRIHGVDDEAKDSASA